MPPQRQAVKDNIDEKNAHTILKHVLQTITKKCQMEDSNIPSISFPDYQAKIEHYTGLSYKLIEKIISENLQKSELALESRISILDAVKNLYVQDRIPTFKTIFEEASLNIKTNDDHLILDYNLFAKEMSKLGYLLKDTVNVSAIAMEDPVVRFERFMYLYKVKKNRSNNVQWQNIVYVDERLINDTHKFKKPYMANSSQIQCGLEECVFYHAVTKAGFTTGMFSNQCSEADFAKWVSDILLIHLKTPSVIIMDSNPLHGSLQNDSSISRYHSKTDMLRWLTDNNIPCSSNMSKPALYELISRYNDNHKEYHIDRIIRSHGHQVLRLPRHFYDLSITSLFWKNLVQQKTVEDTNNLMELEMAVMKEIMSVPAATWAEYEQSIEKIENQIFDIDMSMENLCDMYEIK